LAIVALFVFVSYSAFSFSTRSEQNQVWVGLAKETAHQLGTPISSLMGWVECIENDIIPDNAADEMKKDIDRLQIITERFSKIGSTPVLEIANVNIVLETSLKYLSNRISNSVDFQWKLYPKPVMVNINVNLFNWVIENVVKNSVDAMEGKGRLRVEVNFRNNLAFIDVIDNGKGIPRNQTKDIFKPGFTTKKRGWGLGLSLAKRIVEDYHKGQIFVKESHAFDKTVIRIILKCNNLE
jgi:signal transduction histidine kinase